MCDLWCAGLVGSPQAVSNWYEQINRVIVLFSTSSFDFCLKLSIAFCTVHILGCVLIEILDHTTAVHVPCVTVKSSMPKHCHTFLIHVSLWLCQCHYTVHCVCVLISSTDTL